MFCVTPSMSHNKETEMATPTWSLPFCTQNHLLHPVSQAIHCVIVTATTSNTIQVASLDTLVVWFTPTVPPLCAKNLLASHHRDTIYIKRRYQGKGTGDKNNDPVLLYTHTLINATRKMMGISLFAKIK